MKSIKTWLGICLSVLLLIGCGGGGEAGGDARVAGVGSGGTGGGDKSYAAGMVTEVNGDVVVNGIHFDTREADISNVNDPTTKLTTSDIRPGMMVEIDGTGIEEVGGKLFAKALNVRITSQIFGRVIDIRVDGTYVLGMRVVMTEHTRFDEMTLPNGAQDIAIGDVIEVHGFLDSTRKASLPLLVATRVIRRPDVDNALFFLQGLIEKTINQEYKIVGLPFTWQYTEADYELGRSTVRLSFPASILKVIPTPGIPVTDPKFTFPSPGDLTANIKVTMPTLEGGDDLKIDAYLDGVVTALDLANEHFWISNVEVNARQTVPRLACLNLVKGDRVRVRGWIQKNQTTGKNEVHATKVEVLDKTEEVSASQPPGQVTCPTSSGSDAPATSAP